MKKISLFLTAIVFCLLFLGTVQAESRIHTVKRGEILGRIANLYNCKLEEIYRLSGKKARVEKIDDIDMIQVGWVLVIPTKSTNQKIAKIKTLRPNLIKTAVSKDQSGALSGKSPTKQLAVSSAKSTELTNKKGTKQKGLTGEKFGFTSVQLKNLKVQKPLINDELRPKTNVFLQKTALLGKMYRNLPVRAFRKRNGPADRWILFKKGFTPTWNSLYSPSAIIPEFRLFVEIKYFSKTRKPKLSQSLTAQTFSRYPRIIIPILLFSEKMTLKKPADKALASNIPANLETGEFSGYTSRAEETDSTPFITADGTDLRTFGKPVIANNVLSFGTKVLVFFKKPGLEEIGELFEVRDRMNSRYGGRHFDVYFGMNLKAAKKFGRKNLKYAVLN